MTLQLPRPNAAIAEGSQVPMSREWLRFMSELLASASVYDLSVFWPGIPATGEMIARFKVVRAFTLKEDCPGSLCSARVAATVDTTLSIRDSGVQFGTIVFSAGGSTGVFSSTAHDFAIGDTLEIACVAADVTLAGVSVTIACNK